MPGLQPTYEELKRGIMAIRPPVRLRLQPTYEELKRYVQ